MSESVLRCRISTDLDHLRCLIRTQARHGGLRGPRLEDLVLAANEAISNVLEHGGAGGTLTVRCVSTGVTVEVADAAGLLTPAHLAGAKLDLTGSRGFGLWIIQHLCDEVGLEQAAGGSVLTMRMDPSRHVSRALD